MVRQVAYPGIELLNREKSLRCGTPIDLSGVRVFVIFHTDAPVGMSKASVCMRFAVLAGRNGSRLALALTPSRIRFGFFGRQRIGH